MVMFGMRRKEEFEILQRSLVSLENSQKNTEVMVSTFCNMFESKNDQNIDITKREKVTDEEKRRAAYALNLCTVSISQIIDYNDENILEQEYETILNNLNLENMPKDEALLNILKQILDTVTFFRIQKGDKAFIEKEYQQKVKNAIWASVPNIGLIVAGGNPFTMAFSIASQVGIGYMNYRKAKAENKLDKEKQEWQLQRSAIEQLNGLRRELFDASWRLADRYEFKDEYRLTERQISQYNKILMDPDDYRRYERLEAVSQYFVAYPSFWYHYGHAANCIAQKAVRAKETEIYVKYRELAIKHFDKYMNSDKYALLREDQITSSCALEYIDLLNIETDVSKIKELLDRAIKMSGQICDILQLCAIDYLRISDIDSAVKLLKYLINEDYNTVTNAQILSSLYVSEIVENSNSMFIADYKILQKKISTELLFPYPEENEDIETLKGIFIERQRKALYKNYVYVMGNYNKKCEIVFNKSIPTPYEEKDYPDIFYSDEYEKERLDEYKRLFSNKNKAEEYVSRLIDSNFACLYLDVFNTMVNTFGTILPGTDSEKQECIWKLAGYIETKIDETKELLNNLQKKMNGRFEITDFEKLYKLSFEFFTKDFMNNLLREIGNHISSVCDMSQFSNEETMLREFCISHDIPELKVILNSSNKTYDDYTENILYFSSEILGGEAFEKSNKHSVARKMAARIDEYIEEIIPESKKAKAYIYTKWNRSLKTNFVDYFRKGRKKYYSSNADMRDKIIAVLVDESLGIGKIGIVFLIDGIILDKGFVGFTENPTIISYEKISGNKKLDIDGKQYKNKEINMNALYDMIQELAELSASINKKNIPVGSLEVKDVYMIESNN